MGLKEGLLSGELAFGCFTSIPHPVSIEICALQGFDVLCIDAEHSQIDRERLENLIRACDSRDVPAMVRVPGAQPEWIASALDAGAGALLVPRVSTAETARAVVQAALYPPRGARGAGPGRSSSFGYGLRTNFIPDANARLLIAVQIETVEGLANADEIAAVEGVDMLFVGPFDLSISLRAQGSVSDAELASAASSVAASALGHGKLAGTVAFAAPDIRKWSEAGFTFFLIGSDSSFIGASAQAALASARAS